MTRTYETTDEQESALAAMATQDGSGTADAKFQSAVDAAISSVVSQAKGQRIDRFRSLTIAQLDALEASVPSGS